MLSIRAQSIDTRPHQGYFWTLIAAVFAASVWGTVRLCDLMSGNDMRMPGGWTMSMAWMRMPGQTWPGAFASFISMWTVMMVAMMLPCLAPMLAAYRQRTRQPHLSPERELRNVDARTALVGIGYFSTWVVVGVVAYAVGIPIAYAQMRHDALSTPAPLVAAVIVLIVGVAQFTHWKVRLLRGCRAECRAGNLTPTLSLERRGSKGSMPAQGCRHGNRDAFSHGLHLGVDCARCCAGYMLILLVTNVMSLPIMTAVMVAIAVERLLPHPAIVARLCGVVTVVAGLVMLVRAIWVQWTHA